MKFKNYFTEKFSAVAENPVLKPGQKFSEAKVGDLSFQENVKSIYTLIRAINTERLNRNYRVYSEKGMKSKTKDPSGRPAGYESWINPYPAPVIRDHNLTGSYEAAPDIPMGRVVASFFKAHSKEVASEPAGKNLPGSKYGSGSLYLLANISDPTEIERTLTGTNHTVSIGCNCESVVCSISGIDLVKAMKNNTEMPRFYPGQVYENKLCYWTMGAVYGREVSFVNEPSDVYANVVKKSMDEAEVKLLLGEKSTYGDQGFKFYDPITREQVEVPTDEISFDESYFKNSIEIDNTFSWMPNLYTESVTEVSVGSMVTWGSSGGNAKGKIVSIHRDGSVPGIAVKITGSKEEPAAKIQIYRDGKPTDVYVGHKLSTLKAL